MNPVMNLIVLLITASAFTLVITFLIVYAFAQYHGRIPEPRYNPNDHTWEL